MSDQSFPKSEKLCSRKIISSLFDDEKGFYVRGYKVLLRFCKLPADVSAQIAFTAPKKIYRRAVQRNLVKRRLRECYRKDKQRLFDCLSTQGKQMAVMIVSLNKQIPPYQDVQQSMKEIINILIKRTSDDF